MVKCNPSKSSCAHFQEFLKRKRETQKEYQKAQVLALVQELEVEHQKEIKRFGAHNASLGQEVACLQQVIKQNKKHFTYLEEQHTKSQIWHNKNYNGMIEKLAKAEWELKDKKEKLDNSERTIRNLRRANTNVAGKIAELEEEIYRLNREF